MGCALPLEPADKRAVAFFDGQNLFHAARSAFGYNWPNYNPPALAAAVCTGRSWRLKHTRFYTGVPDAVDNPFWNHFWTHKLAMLGRQGVHVYGRPLRYRNKRVRLPDGREHTFRTGEEKGIDVRIALDVIRMAHRREYDVALVFSQDQDLSEAADDIRRIAQEQDRWIKIATAFPLSPVGSNRRGVNHTDWIAIDRTTYDTCLDSRDYRPKGKRL